MCTLTQEESGRPVNINDVVLPLGTFLMFNQTGLIDSDIDRVLALEPGESIVIPVDSELEFTVSRID